MTNPQRNEHLIKIGEFETIGKMTIDNIVRIEQAMDKSIYEIVEMLDKAKLKVADIIVIISIASVKPIDDSKLTEAIAFEGPMVALTAVLPLLSSAFAGQKNAPKSQRPEAAQQDVKEA